MSAFIIAGVNLTPRGDQLTIAAEDGRKLEINLHGDCCSSTFFDDDARMDVADCLGHTLLKIQEGGELPGRTVYEDSDVEAYYSLHITTNKADFHIPFRNDSNGYYGGSAEWDKDWDKS